MEEIWKDIPIDGLYGKYKCSSYGRIRTIGRMVQHKAYGAMRVNDRVICGNGLSGRGYKRVTLITGDKARTYMLHTLVAKTFIPNPENKPQVNHKNGIKTDNDIANLEWVTNLENREHAIKNNFIPKGEQLPYSKLSEQRIIDIFRMSKLGFKQREIGAKHSVGQQTISNILRGKSWKHLEIGKLLEANLSIKF